MTQPPFIKPEETSLDIMRAAIIRKMRTIRNALIGGVSDRKISMLFPEEGILAANPSAAFQGALWSLVADGVIVPGHMTATAGFDDFGSTRSTFPYFTITPYGLTLLDNPEADPVNREAYLGDARSRLGDADEVIYTYLAEATKNLHDRSYLSGTVMLGVAAEMLMKWLIFRFINHVPERKRAEYDGERVQLWPRTDKLFDRFINGLIPKHYDEVPKDLRFQADASLDQLQTLIRVNRDDVGHGRPQRADRTLLHGNLLVFMTLIRIARELVDAWGTQCTLHDP